MNTYSYISVALSFSLGVAVLWARRQSFTVPWGYCGLLYRNGKSLHRISPGRHVFWKGGYSVRLVNMRKTRLEVAAENISSADGSTFEIKVSLIYQIIQAETVVREVGDYELHLYSATLTALRAIIGAGTESALSANPYGVAEQILALVKPKADRIGIVIHSLCVGEISATVKADNPFQPQPRMRRREPVLVGLNH